MEILRKLWRGEFSLVKTYWLFYVLIWNVSLLPLVLWRQTSQSIQDSYLFLGLLFASIFIAYGCVVLVGLWRSASRYVGWWLWASLAKVIVLLGIVIVVISIFGALQTNLIVGGALFLSTAFTLTLMKFYKTDGYTKNIKVFLAICLALFGLLVASLGFNFNFMGSNKKSNWMPLIKSLNYEYTKQVLNPVITYLDFSSITSKNGFTYAYVANEYEIDGVIDRTAKQFVEFDCLAPKFRVLSVSVYAKGVDDGFGKEIKKTSDVQAEIAKAMVKNGSAYTGGWDYQSSLEIDEIRYCGKIKSETEMGALYDKQLCSSAKKDLVLLTTVCGNR